MRVNITGTVFTGVSYQDGWTRVAEVIPGPYMGQERFPSDHVATASSVHAPDSLNGTPRSYNASFAIDGNTGSYWSDNSENQSPDSLSIISGLNNTLVLLGVTVISLEDGYPQDLVVYTSVEQQGEWVPQATVTANTSPTMYIPFPSPVSVRGINITVTSNHRTSTGGNFTRISEVKPILPDQYAFTSASPFSLPGSPPSVPSNSSTASSTTSSTTSPGVNPTQSDPPNNHATKNNAGVIAGSVIGAIAAITLAAGALLFFRRRRYRQARGDLSDAPSLDMTQETTGASFKGSSNQHRLYELSDFI